MGNGLKRPTTTGFFALTVYGDTFTNCIDYSLLALGSPLRNAELKLIAEMFAVRLENHQVIWIAILTVTVPVVDNFSRQKIAAKNLFHYQPML